MRKPLASTSAAALLMGSTALTGEGGPAAPSASVGTLATNTLGATETLAPSGATVEPLVPTGTVLPDAPSLSDTATLAADAAKPDTVGVVTDTATLAADAAKPAPDGVVTDAAMTRALAHAADRLSPVAKGPIPAPLPAVQPFGTKGATLPERPVLAEDEAFDRHSVIERLLTHPSPEVRQRAAEAQVAIHHGAADVGIKVKAAIDTARGAESRR